MKKILALVLALMLVLSTSVVAFAADPDPKEGDVKVNITSNDPSAPDQDPDDVDPEYAIYSVTIDTKDVEFTYEISDLSSYNPTTHQYNGAWKEGKTTGDIKITNDSNTGISVAAAFKEGDGFDGTGILNGVTSVLSGSPVSIASAAASGTSQIGNVGVTVSGAPTVSAGYIQARVTLTITGTTKD